MGHEGSHEGARPTDLAGNLYSFIGSGRCEHVVLAHVGRPVWPRGALISRDIDEFVGGDTEERRCVRNERSEGRCLLPKRRAHLRRHHGQIVFANWLWYRRSLRITDRLSSIKNTFLVCHHTSIDSVSYISIHSFYSSKIFRIQKDRSARRRVGAYLHIQLVSHRM